MDPIQLLIARALYDMKVKEGAFGARQPGAIPWTGRSKSHKGHVRKIKAAQRRRAHLRLLRK